MIVLAAAVALHCHCAPPVPKPRPVYTRQMRLKDSFELLGKQPTSYQFLYEPKSK